MLDDRDRYALWIPGRPRPLRNRHTPRWESSRRQREPENEPEGRRRIAGRRLAEACKPTPGADPRDHASRGAEAGQEPRAREGSPRGSPRSGGLGARRQDGFSWSAGPIVDRCSPRPSCGRGRASLANQEFAFNHRQTAAWARPGEGEYQRCLAAGLLEIGEPARIPSAAARTRRRHALAPASHGSTLRVKEKTRAAAMSAEPTASQPQGDLPNDA